MTQPLLQLNPSRPHNPARQVSGGMDWLRTELGRIGPAWQRRKLLRSAGLASLGAAAMIWTVVSTAQAEAPWALVGVPVLPVFVAAACLLALRGADSSEESGTPASVLDTIREHLLADMDLMRPAQA